MCTTLLFKVAVSLYSPAQSGGKSRHRDSNSICPTHVGYRPERKRAVGGRFNGRGCCRSGKPSARLPQSNLDNDKKLLAVMISARSFPKIQLHLKFESP